MITAGVPVPEVLTGAPARDDFSALQADVCGRLESDVFFVNVPVIQEFSGTSDTDAAEALATTGRLPKSGKAGACVIVHEAERIPENPNAPGPQYQCDILVRCLELPKVNRAGNGTGKTARIISQYVEQLFHGWKAGPTGWIIASSLPYSDPETGAVGRDVTLRKLKALPELPRCKPPVLSAMAGHLSATCATPGVRIVYTFDGSFPRDTPAPGAPGFEYGPPVALQPPGTLYRAVAYAEGMAASNLVEWRVVA